VARASKRVVHDVKAQRDVIQVIDIRGSIKRANNGINRHARALVANMKYSITIKKCHAYAFRICSATASIADISTCSPYDSESVRLVIVFYMPRQPPANIQPRM
jgi:hypothetical protein